MSIDQDNENSLKIDPALVSEMKARDGEKIAIPVIVVLENLSDIKALSDRGVLPKIVFESISAFSTSLTFEQINMIIEIPQVKSVQFDSDASATRPDNAFISPHSY